MNAGEAANAGAAGNAQQKGFGLIVEGVGGGDLRDPAGSRQLAKKCVAQFASGGFDAGGDSGMKRGLGDMEFEVVLTSQIGHKKLVLVGFLGAQIVIDVSHRQHDAELVPQIEQQAEERDGIGSAGNGNRKASPARIDPCFRIVFRSRWASWSTESMVPETSSQFPELSSRSFGWVGN